MNARFVFFSQIVGIVLFSQILSFIPLVNFVFWMIVLVFLGKKYFLAIVALTIFQSLPMAYGLITTESVIITSAMNKIAYDTVNQAVLLSPTQAQTLYASSHVVSILGIAFGAIMGIMIITGLFVFIHRWVRKTLVPRVRRFA